MKAPISIQHEDQWQSACPPFRPQLFEDTAYTDVQSWSSWSAPSQSSQVSQVNSAPPSQPSGGAQMNLPRGNGTTTPCGRVACSREAEIAPTPPHEPASRACIESLHREHASRACSKGRHWIPLREMSAHLDGAQIRRSESSAGLAAGSRVLRRCPAGSVPAAVSTGSLTTLTSIALRPTAVNPIVASASCSLVLCRREMRRVRVRVMVGVRVKVRARVRVRVRVGVSYSLVLCQREMRTRSSRHWRFLSMTNGRRWMVGVPYTCLMPLTLTRKLIDGHKPWPESMA